MKNLLKSILFLTAISIFTLTSCANGSSGGSNDNSEAINIAKSITFSDISFDSFNYTLEANTTAPDGTSIAAAANNHATTAVASKGKISWNMAESFHNGILGGNDYEVYFSYEGASISNTTVSYWPEIKYEINCPELVYLYNGSGQTYQYPEIIINNYQQSDIKIEKSLRTTGANLDLEQFKEFVDNKDNIIETDENGKVKESTAKSAYLIFNIYPVKISELEDAGRLWQTGQITYLVKQEVEVKYVQAEYSAGSYEAKTYTSNPNENSTESKEAGGKITYQWQMSDTGNNWQDISGATSRFYKIQEEDTGKYLRVIMTQTMQTASGEKTLSPLTSESSDKILNGIKAANLYYDLVTVTGGEFLPSWVKGTLTTIFDSTINLDGNFKTSINSKYASNKSFKDLQVSQNVDITITRANFQSFDTSVYVPVTSKLKDDELPSLSTDTKKITDGYVSFNTINADLEFSNDSRKTWTEIPVEEFAANAGDILYFRKKAFGTPNTEGYIKESSPLSITVKSENLGKLVAGSGAIGSINMIDLKLVKSTKGGATILTPVITHKQPYYFNYKIDYEIDELELSTYQGKGAYKNSDDCFVLEKDNSFAKDTYQINCVVKVYIKSDEDEAECVLILSRQISLKIE